tara:strand:+ start:41 stop:1054 length:1014 start_codon:yes stop_codon:yes gene_type:complete
MNKNKTIIIAEAGVNHNGSIKKAKKLIDIAKKAEADIVKFQTFDPNELVTPDAQKPPYQKKNTLKNQTQHQMLKKLAISKEMHKKLFKYAKSKKIEFLSTAFDSKSLKMLIKMGIKRIKIPSGEITNLPLLKFAAKQKLPVILSTGMSNIHEVKLALKILTRFGKPKSQITVLHCTSDYPASIKDINLKAMQTLNKSLNLSVGYSDHSLGKDVAIAAVAMGAKIIEKHFTINRKLYGPDHKMSLEPEELKIFIRSIKNLNIALGNGKKVATKNENKNKIHTRRSIVAIKKIRKGELFDHNNIAAKRPGKGISPMNLDKLIGKKAKHNFLTNQKIKIK